MNPLSPDLLLIRPDEVALVVECKYSPSADVIRAGFPQLMGYGVETRTALAPKVVGLVVGPTDVVARATWTTTVVGELGIGTTDSFPRALELLREEGDKNS